MEGDSSTQLVAVASRRNRQRYLKSKASPLERRLKALAIFLVLLVVGLGIGLSTLLGLKAKETAKTSVCTTEMCVKSASQLLSAMDTSVNPCHDFYSFACNNWPKSNPPRDDAISHSWFRVAGERMKRDLRRVLEATPVEHGHGSQAVRKAAKFYRSCMDQAGSDAAGFGPLSELLRSMGLPAEVPSEKTLEGFRLSTSLARIQRHLGLGLLVEVDIMPDSGRNLMVFDVPRFESSPFMSLITPPETRFAHEPWRRRENLKNFGQAMRAYFTDLMAAVNDEQTPERRQDPADIRSIANQTLHFASKIALITLKAAESPSGPIIFLPVAKMPLVLYPEGSRTQGNQIDMVEFVTALLEGVKTEFNMDRHDVVLVNHLYLQAIMLELSKTDQVTVQRYLWLMVVEKTSQFTTRRARMLHDELHRVVNPEYRPLSRGFYCTETTHHYLRPATTFALSTQRPGETLEHAKHVRVVLDDVYHAFRAFLADAGWLKTKTRSETLKKLEKIANSVGYTSKQRQGEHADAMLRGLELDGSTFFSNVRRVKSFAALKMLETISTKVRLARGIEALANALDALEVNAFYSRDFNAIVVPPGMLQTPFLDRGMQALNYAAIGSILGHELTHGFDSEGRKYNQNGVKTDWWDERDVNEFDLRADCFVRQYDNFTLASGAKIDGLRTLPENIADNGGLREAYQGYQLYLRRSGPEPKLPGLEAYTHQQLFFLAFANLWCGIEPGSEFDWAILNDVHSPAKFRVLGSLQNAVEFDAAWNCSENGSDRGQKEYCILW